MNLTIDEILQANIITTDISCNTLNFPDYFIVADEGGEDRFLIGKINDEGAYASQPSIRGFHDFHLWAKEYGCSLNEVETNSLDFFMDFIKMAEKILSSNRDRNALDDMIITYCKKHGLPLTQIIQTDEHFFMGFSMRKFIEAICSLFTGYGIWRYLQLKDASIIRISLPNFKSKENRVLQQALENQCNHKLHAILSYEKNKPKIKYYCESLIEIAAVQLTFLVARADNYLEKASIDHCDYCGAPFLKYTKGKKSCPNCSSPSGKSRRYRINKEKNIKEASSNASKE